MYASNLCSSSRALTTDSTNASSRRGLLGRRVKVTQNALSDDEFFVGLNHSKKKKSSLSMNRDDRDDCDERALTESNNDRFSVADFGRLLMQSRLASAMIIVAIATNSVSSKEALGITENQLLFLEAWRAVDKAYVDKTFNKVNWFKYRENTVKNERMTSKEDAYAQIKIMLKLLDDPFTRFLEPDQYSAIQENTMNANVSGIGVELTIDLDDQVRVVAPTIDAPAYLAGIKPLDTILEIDAQSLKGLSLYEVAEMLRGPQGSEVLLKIERASDKTLKNLSVTRKKYNVIPVKSVLCAGSSNDSKIGVVKLQTFNSLSAAKTKEAFVDLANKGATSYVLDLRDDSGGLFPGAIDIASQLMKKGTIVQIADAEGVRDTFEVNGKPLENVFDKKLSVVVNKGTASASEVLTAALQDNDRATIFGDTPTYGKGLIQTIVPLSDGSAVNVTVAKYQTPLGTDINKIGIIPNKKLPIGKNGETMPEKLTENNNDKSNSVNSSDSSDSNSSGSFCEYVASLEDGTF